MKKNTDYSRDWSSIQKPKTGAVCFIKSDVLNDTCDIRPAAGVWNNTL